MVIAEIGPREIPVFVYSSGVRNKMNQGAAYIGIDIDREAITNFCFDEFELTDKAKANIHPIIGNLADIPLQSNSVDEIWLVNVLGGGLRNLPRIQPDGSQLWIMGSNQYFTECARVLKLNGHLYIAEWLPRDEIDYLVKEDFHHYGMYKKIYAGEQWQNAVTLHRLHNFRISKDTPAVFIDFAKLSPYVKS